MADADLSVGAALRAELEAAALAVEARRFDDLFASRALIRLGKALIAYHEYARPSLSGR